MSHDADQRRYPRLPFDVQVEIRTQEKTLAASTRDICMRGLFARGLQGLPLGTVCQVAVELVSGHQRLAIEARGKVVRQVEGMEVDSAGIGVEFVDMDAYSQETLWRVIRYNSQAADGV